MASIPVFVPPLHAPGEKVAKALALGLNAIRSEAVNYNSTTGLTVFSVPAHTLVVAVIYEATTAWDGAIPSLALGVTGATGRHMLTSEVDVKTIGLYPVLRPYNYTADAALIATIVASTATVGVGYFWLLYRSYSNTNK